MKRFIEVNYWWIFWSIVIGLIAHYIRAARWRLLIEPLGYRPSNNNLFYATMIGYLTNIVTPKLGDITRSLTIKRTDNISASSLLGTLIVERAFDILVLLLIMATVFLFHIQLLTDFFLNKVVAPFQSQVVGVTHYWPLILGSVAIILMVLIVGVIWNWKALRKITLVQKIMDIVIDMIEGLQTIFQLKKGGQFFVYTVLMWFFYMLSFYIAFWAITATSHLNFGNAIFVQAFSALGWAMPVHAGVGAFHWAVSQSLVLLNIDYETGLVFATVKHTAAIILNLVGGTVGLIAILWKVGRSLSIKDIRTFFRGAPNYKEEETT